MFNQNPFALSLSKGIANEALRQAQGEADAADEQTGLDHVVRVEPRATLFVFLPTQ